MKTQTFHLELITPCFCGGAEPEQQAEIRAPSIRGQLRWWFRTLGGLKSIEGRMSLRDQEAMIFGSTAGDEGRAGKLLVRVISQIQSVVRDGQELGHPNFTDPAYFTFPIQSRERNGQKISENGRGVMLSGSFTLKTQWRGDPSLWVDLKALVSVFGNLGSLGFRGRRAMGALAITPTKDQIPTVTEALGRFSNAASLRIFKLQASNSKDAISKLGSWLRQWRTHGRTEDHKSNHGDSSKPPLNRGFKYAKRDHDLGYGVQQVSSEPAFRPAIGLPIIQRIQGGTNNWEWNWNARKRKGEGRFASPVLLRPHKDAQGNWHALVIFVDAHKWPDGKQVFLNGEARAVSLHLYEAMKSDERLSDFAG